ncbi:MAG TPA: diguanylate cyclase [Polyangiaceae bacterium]|jgi:diguanylate cyclase (GGDEF)-like protein
MAELKRGEAKFVFGCVQAFLETFERDVAEVLRRELRGIEPARVAELRQELTLLLRQLESRRVHDAYLPLVRRALLDARKVAASAIEAPLAKVVDAKVADSLRRGLGSYEEFLVAPWLEGVPDARIPRLTDFLSVRFAEEAAPGLSALAPRAYDEKFHILEAPSLALPDLAYYRQRCQIRQASIGLAYADIDDFKAVNTRLTETVVDAKVLPPFMELLESWAFARGHAYRFGGDEYVLLLPNADRETCVALLGELIRRVAAADFSRTKLNVTVGLCVVDPDCYLTDREILARANDAKQRAKVVAKGSIGLAQAPAYAADEVVAVQSRGAV